MVKNGGILMMANKKEYKITVACHRGTISLPKISLPSIPSSSPAYCQIQGERRGEQPHSPLVKH